MCVVLYIRVCCVYVRCVCVCVVLSVPSPVEHQICPAVCVLMKLSFDEEHRHAMNELGESDYLVLETGSFLVPDWFYWLLILSISLWVTCPCRWSAGGGGAASGGL